MTDFDEYYEATEPGRRERALGWATAIGLQQVDGLKPSPYLLETARRNIEGEITAEEARRRIDEYYEIKVEHDVPEDAEEADKVAARINQIIHTPSFRLSPEYYLGLHGKIFDGVFAHAGQIREVDLTKREWVLNGDSVQYEASFLIEKSLAYDFEQEKKFKYGGMSDDAFIEHFSSFISGIWQIHPFREGNTRTTAVFVIKYLRSKGCDVTNDLFAKKSFYFRNALVRANYENQNQKVSKTLLPLEEFFKVLVFGEEIELHNRFLKLGQEYGSPAAEAIADLQRHTETENDVVKGGNDVVNVVVNDGVRFSESEEKAVILLLRDARLSAARLGAALGIKPRQAQRVLASLKVKAGLKRRGSDKAGEWYFES